MPSLSIESEEKVSEAVNRLNSILPLKKSQLSLSLSLRQLYKDILFSYIAMGRSLNRHEISLRVDDIEDTVKVLQENDLVVFDEKGEPVGAYPFTMTERCHKVLVNKHQLTSMCALDSLAVSCMFNLPVEIASQCHVSSQTVSIKQLNHEVLNPDDVKALFFAINWCSASNTSCCANSLCTEMIFLQGQSVAQVWQDKDLKNREVFSLDEAIEFSARFFTPLMTAS